MGKVWENWPYKGKQHGDLASIFQLIEPLDCWKGIEIRIRINYKFGKSHDLFNGKDRTGVLLQCSGFERCCRTVHYIYEITQPYIYIYYVYIIYVCAYIYIY